MQNLDNYNPDKKIYIIEAGCGSGQLAFNILTNLVEFDYKNTSSSEFPFV